jgi:hypothetical protein
MKRAGVLPAEQERAVMALSKSPNDVPARLAMYKTRFQK